MAVSFFFICEGVCNVILTVGRLASGSQDKTIKLWNISTNSCESTLFGHIKRVSSIIQLFDNRLASASWDHSIKI